MLCEECAGVLTAFSRIRIHIHRQRHHNWQAFSFCVLLFFFLSRFVLSIGQMIWIVIFPFGLPLCINIIFFYFDLCHSLLWIVALNVKKLIVCGWSFFFHSQHHMILSLLMLLFSTELKVWLNFSFVWTKLNKGTAPSLHELL